MPKIYFKGNMPAIEVTPDQARAVIGAMEEGRHGAILSIGSSSFKVSEVKGVNNESDYKDPSYSDSTKQWADDREVFYKLSIPEKIAKNSGFFALIRKILQYDFPKFEEKVAEFYQKNKYRLFPDFHMIYNEMPKSHLVGKISDIYSARMLVHLGVIIAADREESEKKLAYFEANRPPVQDFLS